MVNKILDIYENPFDLLLLRFIDTHLDVYNDLCITPNMVTTMSLIVSLVSIYSLYNKQFILSGILWIVSYYFDCVDGKLARKFNKVTKFGDYYDHISDTFKAILLVYILYTNTDPAYFKKFIIVLGILIILCLIHLGYQEKIYDKDESPTLDFIKNKLLKGDATKMIQYTKYFGCGTMNLVICLFIIYQEFL